MILAKFKTREYGSPKPLNAYQVLGGTVSLLLFSDDNKFLGCLNCSEYSSESICNKYGTYGSKYNSESIWNQYGTYGSKYNSESPWNEYSSDGPKIVDKDGNYYGRFSINTYSGYSNSDSLKKIYEYFILANNSEDSFITKQKHL